MTVTPGLVQQIGPVRTTGSNYVGEIDGTAESKNSSSTVFQAWTTFAVQGFPRLPGNTVLSPVDILMIRTNNSLLIQAATKRHLVA